MENIKVSKKPVWPVTLGCVGILFSILGMIEQISSLLSTFRGTPRFSNASNEISQNFLNYLNRDLSMAWLIGHDIFAMILLALLLVASVLLLRRNIKGVKLYRTWAILHLFIFLIGIIRVVFITSHFPEDSWIHILLITTIVLCFFPAFVIYWLFRSDIRQEIYSWK